MKIYVIITLLTASMLNAQQIPSDVISLTDQRNAAVEKIDLKYKSELKKLQLAYMKKADLDSANIIEKILKDVEISISDIKKESFIIGEWKVINQNADRRFYFSQDKKFEGQYLQNGIAFEGKWKIENNTIQLFDPDRAMMPQKFVINSPDQIIFLAPTGYVTLEKSAE